MAGIHGQLRLRFARDVQIDRTVMHVIEQQPPLRAIRAFPLQDGGALVHLHNVSGGVLGGDDLALNLDIDSGAIVQTTTTSATRLYRPRTDASIAYQRTTITIGEGGLLEYLPDPLIPFAGARYLQESSITLADNAGFLGWEILAPGREARSECFAFDRVQLRLDIYATKQPILLERATIEPHITPLQVPARMGSYRYLASFYCCHTGLPASHWQALEAELSEIARARTDPGTCVWGVSTLVAHGLLARGLSISGQRLSHDLMAFWQAAKQSIYKADAIPPRKVP
jgi:urease accessory protein